MGLLDRRLVYQPFEYEKAVVYWNQQQTAHWLPSEISMAKDINDWAQEITPSMADFTGFGQPRPGRILSGFERSTMSPLEQLKASIIA